MHVCDYGCGQQALTQFKSGKWCCSTHYSKCPTKRKNKTGKHNPFFSLDPDFGLACCKNCHYEKGHIDECSTGQLANRRCL
jgi:hypothetical protein